MSENIGKLTTPNNDGASIEVTSGTDIRINNQCTIRTNLTEQYKSIEVLSDTDYWETTGAALSLRSKYATNVDSGAFQLKASNGTNKSTLIGYPDTRLNWNSKPIDTIYSSGTNYIQYTNGLGACWGIVDDISATSSKTVTMPITFINCSVTITRRTQETTTNDYGLFVRTPVITSSFSIYNSGSGSTGACWYCIGFWK